MSETYEQDAGAARKLLIEPILSALQVPHDPQLSADDAHVAVTIMCPDLVGGAWRRSVRVLRVEGDGPAALVAELRGELPRWSPDGRTLAWWDSQDPAGARIRLWREGAQDEELIPAAELSDLRWRPDGGALAFVAPPAEPRDQSAPVVLREHSYRMNGKALLTHHDQLHLVTLADGARTCLVAEDFSVTSPAWSPDGTRIAFAAGAELFANKRSRAYVLDVRDGSLQARTGSDGECGTVTWTPDGEALVVVGKADVAAIGHTSVFRVAADGPARVERLAPELDRSVQHGAIWLPGALPLVTSDGSEVLFACFDEGTMPLYAAPLDGGPARKLAGGAGDVVAGVSRGTRKLALLLMLPDSPGELAIADEDGSGRVTVTDLNPGVRAAGIPQAESRWFTASDGTRVQGFVIRPADATGPTPLLMQVHGGPHHAFTGTLRDVELLDVELVLHGWTVLRLNPRGSEGYGEAFYGGVTKGWGERDMDDFMSAIDELVADGTADPDRLTVRGYSYGGFTTNYLVSHTDRFAAAVSAGGISEFVTMYATSSPGVSLISPELGGPPAGRWELYDRLSPLRSADRVTTPLLLIHGLDDQTAPPAQSEAFFTLLRDLGRETELVLYPDCHHILATWPLQHRIDSWRRTVAWLLRHVEAPLSS